MSNIHPHHGETTCPTSARLSLGESLAAPAMTGQGAGTSSDMLAGELSNPSGFHVCASCLFAQFPSLAVREARRA